MKKYRQILLLGGNQGDVISQLKLAISKLSDVLGNLQCLSAYYESEPWGFEADQNFINQVVEFRSGFGPIELLDVTQSIEKELGRKQKTGTHYESRPIDIDVLFIDDQIIDSPRLSVPHLRLHERKFTLLPLMDHWSDFTHPRLKKKTAQLLLECNDEGEVKRID